MLLHRHESGIDNVCLLQEGEMGVPIHQARHEGSATAINHDGVLLAIRGHHRSDARNPAAFDENLTCRRRSNIAGPDCAVGEQQPPSILFQDSLLSGLAIF
jgi:hypothetical protein